MSHLESKRVKHTTGLTSSVYKLMKYSFGLIIILISNSCSITESETYTTHYIINNSSQKIDLSFYKGGMLQDSIRLFASDSKVYKFYRRGYGESPPPFSSESVLIYYNDTILIVHYNSEGQDIRQNILDKESWLGGQIDDYEFHYEYIITDADYDEALNYSSYYNDFFRLNQKQ